MKQLSAIILACFVFFAFSTKLLAEVPPGIGNPLPPQIKNLVPPENKNYIPIITPLPPETINPPASISSYFSVDTVITGKITSETGEPLMGVSVSVKNSTIGTQTDENGEFSIDVPDNATLIISYVGYDTREIPVAGTDLQGITLSTSSASLEQVVVVGYGTQRKRDVTGSVVSVKGEELAKQPVLTATQAVQGKVAGVQVISSGAPGSSPIVRIRGTGTMLGGADPLYVVDGVITNDISNINTADILTFDVLKDASSAAIYGVRGANGVVIITTKKGRSGRMNIEYSANVGMRQAANLVEMANNRQYAAYVNEAYGSMTIDPGETNTDWFDAILRNAFWQNHNLSLSGGSDKVTYFISGGYLTDEGIVINNNYKRFTLRQNTEFKFNNQWKLGIVGSFSNGIAKDINLGAAYNNAYRANPTIPTKVDGKYGNTSAAGNVGNPLLDIEKVDNRYTTNRLQANAYLEFKPVSSLTLRSSIGGDLDHNNRRVYDYQYDNSEETFIVAGGNQRREFSQLNITNNKGFRWLWENTATYSQRFDDHNITIMGGITAEKFSGEFINGSRRGVPADPALWYLGGSGDPNTALSNGGGDKWARNSYIGRVNYGYNDRYLLTVTFRADGSSRFPSQNRWAYIPSVGLGWVISDEGFMQNQDIFSNLKLRASWGRLGNDNIPSDAFTVTAVTGLPYFFDNNIVLGSMIDKAKDKDLRWEITEEFDIGMEFSLLSRRLTGELDYYDKKTKDALVIINVPPIVSADGQMITNAATIQNRGLEVTLRWSDDINKDFSYYIGGNITFNQNKTLDLNGGQALLSGGVGQQSFTTKSDNGQPIGSFYVLQVEGIFQSQEEIDNYTDKDGNKIQPDARPGDFKYLDADGNGTIDNSLDRVYVGSYQPKTYFGINAGFNYKNLDFSIDTYGNTGNKIYNGKRGFRYETTDNVEAAVAANRWQPHDPSTTHPRAKEGYWPASTYFIESGDFFRINNVTLGYTLPEATLQSLKLTSFRVYLTSQNLWTGKKFSGFTPELPSSSPLNAGIELNAYPTTRTFAIGVNVGL